MTPTAWKVIALTLAALLLVAVGVLIGTNLGDDGRGVTQSPAASNAPPDAPASPLEAVRLGDRFDWCEELQASWDTFDNLSIADEQPMWAEEVKDYVDNIGTEATGESARMEVFLRGRPDPIAERTADPTKEMAFERAWSAFLAAAAPETLAALDSYKVADEAAGDANTAASEASSTEAAEAEAAYQASLDAADAVYEAALVEADALLEVAYTGDEFLAANQAYEDARAAHWEAQVAAGDAYRAAIDAAYAPIRPTELAAERASDMLREAAAVALLAAALDSEGTAAYRASFVESCE